jgi:hypothetical protein
MMCVAHAASKIVPKLTTMLPSVFSCVREEPATLTCQRRLQLNHKRDVKIITLCLQKIQSVLLLIKHCV